MKRLATTLTASLIVLALAGVAWAGGPGCVAKEEASVSTGDRCTYDSGKNAEAMACGVKANQVMYSFSVPSAECGHCVDRIRGAFADMDGVHCVHVDLRKSIAYVIVDKKVSRERVSKTIKTAGFSNKYKGSGKKVEAAFAAMMGNGDAAGACCTAKKGKDKV